MRHWSSHYPELNTSKSKCDKCGQQLSNASNRNRHTRECNGESLPIASVTEQDAAQGHATMTLPTFDPSTAFGDALHGGRIPVCDDQNASSIVQHSTQTGSSYYLAWSPSQPAERLSLSTDWLLSTNDQINTLATVPRFSNTKTIQNRVSGSDLDLMSLDTVQISVKQKLIEADRLQQESDFTSGDRLSERSPSWGCGVTSNMPVQSGTVTQSQNSMFQVDGGGILWPSLDPLSLCTQGSQESAVDHQTMALGFERICGLPMKVRRHFTPLGNVYNWSEKRSPSRHVKKRWNVVVVRSYIPSWTGFREVSCDQQVWINMITHKFGVKNLITETTTLILNNVLYSKKKYPRVC